eukprot:661639-Amphidinium_carterae.3
MNQQSAHFCASQVIKLKRWGAQLTWQCAFVTSRVKCLRRSTKGAPMPVFATVIISGCFPFISASASASSSSSARTSL